MSDFIENIDREIARLDQEIQENKKVIDHYKNEPVPDQPKEYDRYKYGFEMEEFIGQSCLVLPHYWEDNGARPTTTAGNSAAIALYKNGTQVYQVEPESDYDLRCLVKNLGDLSLPVCNVEFFLYRQSTYHLTPFEIKSINGNALTVFINTGSLYKDANIVLTLDHFQVFTKITGLKKAGAELLSASEGEEVQVEIIIDNNFAGMHIHAGSMLALDPANTFNNQSEYVIRVEDVFSITGRGTVVTGQVEYGIFRNGDTIHIRANGTNHLLTSKFYSGREFRKLNTGAIKTEFKTGEDTGILLRGVNRDEVSRGDLITKPDLDQYDAIIVPLSNADDTLLKAYDFLGTVSINVSQFNETFAHFSFRTGKVTERNFYRFATRVYALAPQDRPQDLSTLNPQKQRHCAIARFNWL